MRQAARSGDPTYLVADRPLRAKTLKFPHLAFGSCHHHPHRMGLARTAHPLKTGKPQPPAA